MLMLLFSSMEDPEMSVYKVTSEVIEKISEGVYDVIVLNYANPDMVGHTGFINAAIKAVKAVDECLGKVVKALDEAGGLALITADHGNVEEMLCPETNEPVTAHSTSMVPFIVCDGNIKNLRGKGSSEYCCLCDISPTILSLLNIAKPDEMTGKSIIVNNR